MIERNSVIQKLDEKIVERALNHIKRSPPEYIPGIIDPSVKPFLDDVPIQKKETKKKKKRAPSEYNIFIGDCMREGNDMRTCADRYKLSKGSIDESFGISENQEIITLLTEEGCPSCERLKESLSPLIGEGVIKVIDVDGKSEYDNLEVVPSAIIDKKLCDISVKEDGIHFICPGEDDMVVSLE